MMNEESREIYNGYLKKVKSDPLSFSYVPKKYQSTEMCKLGLESTSHATLKNVFYALPEGWRTQEVCEKICMQNYSAIEFLPRKSITKKMADHVVRWSMKHFTYIPHEFWDIGIVRETVDKSIYCPHFIRDIPDELLDRGICIKICKKATNEIRYVHKKYMDDKFIDEILDYYWSRVETGREIDYSKHYVINKIPDNFITKERCERALKFKISPKEVALAMQRTKVNFELYYESIVGPVKLDRVLSLQRYYVAYA